MLVMFLIIIMTMFFYTIIKLRKRDIYKEYEKGQYLENWYSNSVKENGFKWIKRAGEELKKMYGKNITILSIAANKGTYEKELYKHMIKRGAIIHIIVTDIGKMEHEKNMYLGKSKFEYYSEIDAFECVSFIKKIDIEKVNAIFDFKGAFWHQLSRKKGNPEKLLEEYIKILKENGAIIIDSINKPWYQKAKKYIAHVFFGRPGTEQSTYFYLKKKMRKNKQFKNYIDDNFTIEEYAADAEKGINIVIMKKRAV